jgi:hypothetical protein
MLPIVRNVFWVFLKVAVLGWLVAPTATLPNDKLAGVNLLCAMAGEPRKNKDTRAKTARRKSLDRQVAGVKLGMVEEWVRRIWRITNSELRIHNLQQ